MWMTIGERRFAITLNDNAAARAFVAQLTLVVFYSTFTPSYSYTRLGRVNDPAGLAQVLGARSVRVMFSKE